jgi:hypothetical protein
MRNDLIILIENILKMFYGNLEEAQFDFEHSLQLFEKKRQHLRM